MGLFSYEPVYRKLCDDGVINVTYGEAKTFAMILVNWMNTEDCINYDRVLISRSKFNSTHYIEVHDVRADCWLIFKYNEKSDTKPFIFMGKCK